MLSIPKYPEQYAQHFPTIFYLLCCAFQHHVVFHCMWYLGHARRSGRSNKQPPAVVVCIFFRPILDVARIQAKTVTKRMLNNDNASGKEKVRLECAAAVQFMRTWRLEALITMRLEEGGMNKKRVGGRLRCDVCREWWDNFAKMCVYGWQTGWLSGWDVGRLRQHSIRMGKAHLVLQWLKLMWSFLWIDDM